MRQKWASSRSAAVSPGPCYPTGAIAAAGGWSLEAFAPPRRVPQKRRGTRKRQHVAAGADQAAGTPAQRVGGLRSSRPRPTVRWVVDERGRAGRPWWAVTTRLVSIGPPGRDRESLSDRSASGGWCSADIPAWLPVRCPTGEDHTGKGKRFHGRSCPAWPKPDDRSRHTPTVGRCPPRLLRSAFRAREAATPVRFVDAGQAFSVARRTSTWNCTRPKSTRPVNSTRGWGCRTEIEYQ